VWPNLRLSEIWFWSHFVVLLKSDLDVQQTYLWIGWLVNFRPVRKKLRTYTIDVFSFAINDIDTKKFLYDWHLVAGTVGFVILIQAKKKNINNFLSMISNITNDQRVNPLFLEVDANIIKTQCIPGVNLIKLYSHLNLLTLFWKLYLFTIQKNTGYINKMVWLTKSVCQFRPKKFYEIDP